MEMQDDDSDFTKLPPTPNCVDFLPAFKAIGHSLKKRFFKKPNIADAVEQYENLAGELSRDDQQKYAGICLLEASKCHQTLSNPIKEAELLVRAGKHFLQAYNIQEKFVDPGIINESSLSTKYPYLSDSTVPVVQCFKSAANIYQAQGNYGLALLVTMQLGEIQYKQKCFWEALKHYKSALTIAKAHFNLEEEFVVLDYVIKCKIQLCEFESLAKQVSEALGALNQVPHGQICEQFKSQFTQKYEILRVCLILIMGVHNVDLLKFIWPQDHPEKLDEFDEQSTHPNRSETLSHLKSLVLAVQHGSAEEIKIVRDKLFYTLDENQILLFNYLIRMQS